MNRYHDTVLGFRLNIHPALRVQEFSADGYRATFKDLKFIVSLGEEDDKKVWAHCSVSRRDRQTPTYQDLLTLRKYTLPAGSCAYQIFNSIDNTKLQPSTLDLYCCIEGTVTPSFKSKN